ncbi:hypothetical protein SN11_23390 [Vibrio harveyi]|nr:hypothetical protein SN11_23390 [Vibrio harveyi]
MKKTALTLLLSIVGASSAFAATGDTSDGRVTFSGFVPGFVSNGGFIVTGSGGSINATDFKGSLQVEQSGKFTTLSPVRLEGHLWTDEDTDGTNETVGALQAADWVVTGVQVLNVGFEGIADTIYVKDDIGGTEIQASSIGAGSALASGVDTLDISVRNETEVTDLATIAGQDLQVAVDILATSN